MVLTPAQRLKLELLADGIAIGPSARERLSGEDGTEPLTLADYASTSGIALELEGDIWVNAPIEEFNPNFVRNTPHRLEYREGEFTVRSGDIEVEATPIPVPAFASRSASTGRRYSTYGLTHTDRIRIAPDQWRLRTADRRDWLHHRLRRLPAVCTPEMGGGPQ